MKLRGMQADVGSALASAGVRLDASGAVAVIEEQGDASLGPRLEQLR